MLHKDYKEMLQCLSDEGVKFLLVGAYALAAHGFPRATKDIDFFVWANPENGVNVLRALEPDLCRGSTSVRHSRRCRGDVALGVTYQVA
jgi:hypothetical protein